MIRTLVSLIGALLLSLGFLAASCGTTTSNSQVNVSTLQGGAAEKIPETLDSAIVSFRDFNFWQDGDFFCATALVDNNATDWQRIWVRLEYFDAAGKRLTVNGDSSFVVRAFADAIPPRGASSFFVALPMTEFSGVPDSCSVRGAGAVYQSSGPIMVPGLPNGVRIQRPDPKDSTKVIEEAYQAGGTVENPLDMVVLKPWMVMLFYGKDSKLYFAYPISLEKKQMVMNVAPEGPMQPREQRQVNCMLSYSTLPKKLQEILIGRVDFQPYEVRE